LDILDGFPFPDFEPKCLKLQSDGGIAAYELRRA
jgi:hypothetical protein